MPKRIVAIDWSGSAGELKNHKGIARAEWTPDFSLDLQIGFSREEMVEYLESFARQTADLVVGFDFAFSFPQWFARRLGNDIEEVWSAIERDGEQWLAGIAYPFWNKKRCAEKAAEPALRKTDQQGSGGSPKSIFQLVGNGQVGRGSIRGMKYLARLRKAGFSIWPFDAGQLPMIVEIYPTSCYLGAKRTPAHALHQQLSGIGFKISASVARLLENSQDARDAACALMRMVEHRKSFASLPQVTDPATLLEGTIWMPSHEAPLF